MKRARRLKMKIVLIIIFLNTICGMRNHGYNIDKRLGIISNSVDFNPSQFEDELDSYGFSPSQKEKLYRGKLKKVGNNYHSPSVKAGDGQTFLLTTPTLETTSIRVTTYSPEDFDVNAFTTVSGRAPEISTYRGTTADSLEFKQTDRPSNDGLREDNDDPFFVTTSSSDIQSSGDFQQTASSRLTFLGSEHSTRSSPVNLEFAGKSGLLTGLQLSEAEELNRIGQLDNNFVEQDFDNQPASRLEGQSRSGKANGEFVAQRIGPFVNNGGGFRSQNVGRIGRQGSTSFVSQSGFGNQGSGTFVNQGGGTFSSQGSGTFTSQGSGSLSSQGGTSFGSQGGTSFGSQGGTSFRGQSGGGFGSQGVSSFGGQGSGGSFVSQGSSGSRGQGSGGFGNQGSISFGSQSGGSTFGSQGGNNFNSQGGGGFNSGNQGGASFNTFGSGRLEDTVPGIPGIDYPILSFVPDTGFSCEGQVEGGYYADTAAGCQVFHICTNSRPTRILSLTRASFLCPNGTLFDQEEFVCNWWFNVDCSNAVNFYFLNEEYAAERERNIGPLTISSGGGLGSDILG